MATATVSPPPDWPDTDPPIPLPDHLVPLAAFLLERDYSVVAFMAIVAAAARSGSVQCAERWFHGPEDLDGAERLLDGNPWAWGPDADAFVYAPAGV